MSALALPKPIASGPKPKKRLPRATAPIKRSKPPKSVSTSARARRRTAEDTIWRKAVKDRAGMRCEFVVPHVCPSPARDAHHLKTKKAHPKLRWNLDNGTCLCRWAHNFAHRFPSNFLSWFMWTFPGRWARLEKKAQG